MIREVTVFLSGTRTDLAPFFLRAKEIVNARPGYRAILMEDGCPEDLRPDHWSRKEGTKPDLLIGLVGHHYGTVPEGSDVSMTEQEYQMAEKAGADRRMFLTDFRHPYVTYGAEDDERLTRFKGRIAKDVVYKAVASVDDFADWVQRTLEDWERKTLRGATVDGEEFYRPRLEGDKYAGHTLPLIGQTGILSQLETFAASPRRIFVLHAPWGRGKSRVLLEWVRQRTRPIRFIRMGAELSRRTLDISAVDPCILVLEDGHKAEENDVRALLDALARYGDKVKVVITSRTGRLDVIRGLVLEQSFDARQLEVAELPTLTDTEQRALAAAVLQVDGKEAYVIAERTKGSPLACIIAARLLSDGKISIEEIEGDDEFRLHVLDKFRDALLGDLPTESRRDYEDVLSLVALLAPMRPASADLMRAFASFLGWPVDRLHHALEELEDAGLLMRRGGLVRIPVDAVSESQLLRACMTNHGESTGYAERALEQLSAVAGVSMIRNLAMVDWQAARRGLPVRFLRDVWPELFALYVSLPASRRLQLLKDLQDVVPLQPKEALEFVEKAATAEAGPEEESPLLRHSKVSDDWIRDELASMLRGALRQVDLIGRACDLLWGFAENDTRTSNQHPRSGERYLREIGKYRSTKPIEEHAAFVAWAERQYQNHRIPGDRLASYLRALLQKEAEQDWSDDVAIYMEAFGVSYAATAAVRRRALDLLQAIAEDGDLASVAAAIDVMCDAFNRPHGLFGRQVTEAEETQWEPEKLDVLARLRLVRSKHTGRSVDLCILKQILWSAEHAANQNVREGASQLVQELRAALDDTIEYAITPQYELERFHVDDEVQQHTAQVRAIAQRLATSSEPPPKVVQAITQATADLLEMRQSVAPRDLLYETMVAQPAHGEEFVDAILSTKDHPLTPAVGAIVAGVLRVDAQAGISLTERVLTQGSNTALRVLASSYRIPDFITPLGEQRVEEHLRTLLAHEDPTVREEALQAIAHAKSLADPVRITLILEYDVSSAPETGERWAYALVGPHLHERCDPESFPQLIDKLGEASEIDHFGGQLLAFLASREPVKTTTMLIQRIKDCATRRDHFEPVPDIPNENPLSELPIAERRRALYELGDLLRSHDYRVEHAAAQLAALLTVHGSDLREVQLAWATSGKSELVVQAAISLRERPAQVLFEEEELVAAIIRGADSLDQETLRDVRSILVGISLNGVRTGEPAPLDIQIRDQAGGIATKYSQGSPEKRLYEEIASRMEDSISWALARKQERSIE